MEACLCAGSGPYESCHPGTPRMHFTVLLIKPLHRMILTVSRETITQRIPSYIPAHRMKLDKGLSLSRATTTSRSRSSDSSNPSDQLSEGREFPHGKLLVLYLTTRSHKARSQRLAMRLALELYFTLMPVFCGLTASCTLQKAM
jgi:hypothetical protein